MALRSFFVRLFLGNLLLIAVVVLTGGIVSYKAIGRYFLQESYAQQDLMLRILQKHFEADWPQPPSVIHDMCRALTKDSHLRFTVMAADGQVLGDSDADPNHMENHRRPERPEITAALEGGTGEAFRQSVTLGAQLRYTAVPLRKDGQIVGVVRLATRVQDITDSQAFIRDALLAAAATMVGVSVLLALLINRIWSAPLRRIALAAKQIASGDLSSRIPARGSSELAQLAGALNEMRKSLSQQIDAIAVGQEDLQTVITNLQEGLVAVDRNLRVILINQAACTLLGADAAAKDATLGAVIRNADVLGLCDKVVATGKPAAMQIEIEKDSRLRTLDIRMAPVGDHPSDTIAYLLVVRDVTEVARTAAMKAEFVANASHELRTPVATLRAAVDSLAMADLHDPLAIEKLAGILSRHVTRLENMTRDLLDLHAVEGRRYKPQSQMLPLEKIEEWASGLFSTRAAEKDVQLKIQINPSGASFSCDAKLLELIVQNLIDNALKFTPAQGSVQCNLHVADGTLVVRVSDTGCGIRKEDQAHVFERFFQADASRAGDSRQRGTGLGLAIVKHASDRLGARVELQSELGRGTTVTVTIPPQAG